MRGLYLVFSVAAYAVFFATFLYLIAFVAGLPFVPVTVDAGGASASTTTAVLIDLGLVALFGVQHSVMARPAFKRGWTRIVPEPVERSVYVLVASAVLVVLFAFWRPIIIPLWSVGGGFAIALWVLAAIGWATVLVSTFLLNHFELFGLQQTWGHARGTAPAAPEFRTPLFYRVVRHPLYSGFLIAFWAAPVMTAGHALFAAGMTAYVLIAIRHEERDLTALFGDRYRDYRARVGMLAPRLR